MKPLPFIKKGAAPPPKKKKKRFPPKKAPGGTVTPAIGSLMQQMGGPGAPGGSAGY